MIGFILAAGFGKRMKHLTRDIPKPLLSIQGVTLLDYALFLFWKWNIKFAFINTHYLAEKISEHLRKFKLFPVQISYEKEKILGTGGGIWNALPDNQGADPVLLINPDVLLLPLETFSPKSSLPDGSLAHLYLYPRPESADYTRIDFLQDSKLQFDKGNYYYIGLGLFSPLAMETYKKGEIFELGEVFRQLSKTGKITGEIFPGKVIDLGTLEQWNDSLEIDIFGPIKKEITRFRETHFASD